MRNRGGNKNSQRKNDQKVRGKLEARKEMVRQWAREGRGRGRGVRSWKWQGKEKKWEREKKRSKEKELCRERTRKRRTILGSLLWWVTEEFTSPCTPTISFWFCVIVRLQTAAANCLSGSSGRFDSITPIRGQAGYQCCFIAFFSAYNSNPPVIQYYKVPSLGVVSQHSHVSSS